MTKKEKDAQIRLYMKNLDLTYEEALQLWNDDQDKNGGQTEQQKELTRKAKENKSDKMYVSTENKRKTKTKKENQNKETIYKALLNGLKDLNLTDTSDSENCHYIEFNYNGMSYTIKIVEHTGKTKKKQ